MKFSVKSIEMEKIKTDCIIIGIFECNKLKGIAQQLDLLSNGCISNIFNAGDITGQLNHVVLLNNIKNINSKRILLIGCGKEHKFNEFLYKKVIQKSIKTILTTGSVEIVFLLNQLNVNNRNIYWKTRLAIEYIEDTLYSFPNFKTKINKKVCFFSKLIFNAVSEEDLTDISLSIQHGSAITTGIKIAKDISNLPPNICTPLYLSYKAKELYNLNRSRVFINILNELDLKKNGMNAYFSVGKGSKNKSVMSIIKYQGGSEFKDNPIILIGKGVTFDSGGLSLKPSSNMHEMKHDMSGAATVYAVLSTIIKLSLPINLIGVLAGCENMPGGNAFRPGDILTTMSKKTVEVLNTDAEGRLILCDVLTYIERFNPSIVIDIATLTGACIIALGNQITGMMSNDSNLSKKLFVAGEQTGDKVWQLPLFDELEDCLYSNVADMANVSRTSSAGALTAAYFLSKFTKKYKWAHLDIAGTSFSSKKNKGSTGRPVSLIIQFLLNLLN